MSDRAQDYARYRPSYPEGAIAAILADLGDPQELVVADIGAGTGISSRLLGDRGPRVIALEPNAAMGEAAEPHPQVSFQPGTAEQTGLVDQSIHVITCCQAFHWFNAPLALAEFSRILQPGGRVALLWNDWDLDDPRTEAGLPPRGKSEGNRNFAENLGGPEPEEAAEKWEEGWDEYSQPTKKAAGREESDIVRRFHASGAAEAINGPTRSDDDIAGHARKFLAKTAGRVYSLAEQQELIDEPGTARNKPTREDLLGTHYVP